MRPLCQNLENTGTSWQRLGFWDSKGNAAFLRSVFFTEMQSVMVFNHFNCMCGLVLLLFARQRTMTTKWKLHWMLVKESAKVRVFQIYLEFRLQKSVCCFLSWARFWSGPVAQSLGADEVVDYTKEDFAEKYKDDPFDAIVDLIGGETEVKSYDLLKEGGTYAHIRYAVGMQNNWWPNECILRWRTLEE